MSAQLRAMVEFENGEVREFLELPEDYCFAYEYSGNPYPRPTKEARERKLRIEGDGDLRWLVPGAGYFRTYDDALDFYREAMRWPVKSVVRA